MRCVTPERAVPRRPTLVEVARAAGVSRATASRVLAGQSGVDALMALRVREAAERLDYRTNTAARSLRSGATGSIALIIPDSAFDGLAGPFVASPLRGASVTISAAGKQPVLLLDDGRQGPSLAAYMSAGHVDGAVVVAQRETETAFRYLQDLPVPVIYVCHPTTAMDDVVPYVDADNYGGARLAARTLLEAGRRRLTIVSGPGDYFPSQERARGFADEVAAWGLTPGPSSRGDYTMPSGASAMADLLSRAPDLDGVFATSDLMAVGAMRVLAASGRAVPDDVSVVGFDDTVVAATASPALTSVHQPLTEMGALAASILLASPAGTAIPPAAHVLETTVTVRESV